MKLQKRIKKEQKENNIVLENNWRQRLMCFQV